MSALRRFTAAALLPAALAWGAGATPARAEEPAAELDVVAQTAVRVAPQHTQAVQRALVEYARRCLRGVVSANAPVADAAPADGAARYRLFIEHTATVKVATTPTKETYLKDEDYFGLFLVTQETGAYKFRLAEWRQGRYVPVDQWGGPYTATHRMQLGERVNSREIPPLRERALAQALPTSVEQALLGRLLPMQVAESRGAQGTPQAARVLVKNQSPWRLVSLGATLRWPDPRARQGTRYEGAVILTAPLDPGKQAVLPCTGKPLTLDYRWQYEQPMEVEAAPVFAPVPAAPAAPAAP